MQNLIKNFAGIDIGGTKCAVVLGKSSATGITILDRLEIPTESFKGPKYIINRLVSAMIELIRRNEMSIDEICSVGISYGGPLNANGIIMDTPNLPGWEGIPIADHFATLLGIRVLAQNDANACALAEWKWGAGIGCQHMVFLTFGTGLGAGIIVNGRLYVGACGLAGEVGHVRLSKDGPMGHGKEGSFEGYCSGTGIKGIADMIIKRHISENEAAKSLLMHIESDQMTAKSVAQAAAEGDLIALEIFSVTAHYLGMGLAMLIDVLNPEVIVIGSIFTRQQDMLWPTAEKIIRMEALADSSSACRIVPAKLGELIGDYAALSVASEA